MPKEKQIYSFYTHIMYDMMSVMLCFVDGQITVCTAEEGGSGL